MLRLFGSRGLRVSSSTSRALVCGLSSSSLPTSHSPSSSLPARREFTTLILTTGFLALSYFQGKRYFNQLFTEISEIAQKGYLGSSDAELKSASDVAVLFHDTPGTAQQWIALNYKLNQIPYIAVQNPIEIYSNITNNNAKLLETVKSKTNRDTRIHVISLGMGALQAIDFAAKISNPVASVNLVQPMTVERGIRLADNLNRIKGQFSDYQKFYGDDKVAQRLGEASCLLYEYPRMIFFTRPFMVGSVTRRLAQAFSPEYETKSYATAKKLVGRLSGKMSPLVTSNPTSAENLATALGVRGSSLNNKTNFVLSMHGIVDFMNDAFMDRLGATVQANPDCRWNVAFSSAGCVRMSDVKTDHFVNPLVEKVGDVHLTSFEQQSALFYVTNRDAVDEWLDKNLENAMSKKEEGEADETYDVAAE